MTPFKQTGFPEKRDKPKHIFTQFQVTSPFSLYSSFSKMQTKTGKVEVAEREHTACWSSAQPSNGSKSAD